MAANFEFIVVGLLLVGSYIASLAGVLPLF
jgi:hypothetical protein